MDEVNALATFGALSNVTRLRILKYLVRMGCNGKTAGEIGKAVEATPSRASFHLATMTETGLLVSERRSREIFYKVNFNSIGNLVHYLIHDCCEGNNTVQSCCNPKDNCE